MNFSLGERVGSIMFCIRVLLSGWLSVVVCFGIGENRIYYDARGVV